jgi:hypothetical protein
MTVDRELVTRKLLLVIQDLDAVAPFAAKSTRHFSKAGSIRRWSSGCWNG